nr:hypothetical protein [Tanacetum cinerariifolium]
YSPKSRVLVGICDFRSWDSVESGGSCWFSGEMGSRELARKEGRVNNGLNVETPPEGQIEVCMTGPW